MQGVLLLILTMPPGEWKAESTFRKVVSTGVDLSKILGGNQNIGGQKVVKSDKFMGISQLLGGTCPGCPQVYAYAVFELPGCWGLYPYLILPTNPLPLVKVRPRGFEFQPPPKFCWSWYAAWFTLPSNAVLKISTARWFDCYNLNSYWRLGLSSPGLSVKFLLRTWICNNMSKNKYGFCNC